MHVIILGATSAIAEAVAKEYARQAADLTLVGRKENKLKAISDDLLARGATTARYIVSELADCAKHEELYAKLGEKDYDVALIAYGSLGNQQTGEDDVSSALKVLDINFTSACSHLTYLAKYFRQKKSGRIAVITSVAGDRGRQSNYIYGSAKGGLGIFLQGLRNSLHKDGVSVTDIRPGFVASPMTEHLKQGMLFAKPDAIAPSIVNAVSGGRDIVYVPWFWRFIMLIIRNIPECLFKRLSL
jgi:hypothetical protein